MRYFTFFIVAIISVGCAGIGVFSSSDPLVKLNDAAYLYKSEDRPLIAERLIREAMTIYQQQDNAHGLGNAHREYADLLVSPSVSGKWQKFYREHGFQDTTVTYDNRAEKATEYYRRAIEYYNRAADELANNHKYDALTNVYWNLAHCSLQLGDHAPACGYYDKALDAYQENIRRNPNAKPYSPNGSVPDLIANKKKYAGCK